MSDYSSININFRDLKPLRGKFARSRNRFWNTREADIKYKIMRMSRAKDNISFVYRECLRSTLNQFSNIHYFNDSSKLVKVKTIHSNPERAIAKLHQENSIVLPIISISQTTSSEGDRRRRYKTLLVNEKLWDPEKNRAYRVLSLSPRPVDINYDIHVWCKYKSDMDQITEQVRGKFNPELQIPTKYSSNAKAFLSSETESGILEAGDKEDRVIRKRFTITLRTFIPSPKFLVTATGKVEEFNVELYEKLSNIDSVSQGENTVVPDTTPPSVPLDLEILEGDEFLTLLWSQVNDTDLSGYQLYKSEFPPSTEEDLTLFASVIKGVSNYTDSNLTNGQTYYYAVASVDVSGNESEKSPTQSGTPEAKADTIAPDPPLNLVGVFVDGKVDLSWDPPAIIPDDFLGYYVERKGPFDSEFGRIGNLLTNLQYMDNTVINGQVYEYRVQAIDDSFNESAYSNTVTGTPQADTGSEDLTFNFDTTLTLNQYYLDTAVGTLGQEKITPKSLVVNINSNDNFVRDNQNGLSYCIKYAKFALESSFIPGTPTYPKTGTTYTSVYPEYETGYKSDKAMGCHVIVTEHDAFPGSYEVSIMLSNGFQNNGYVYANSLQIATQETISGEQQTKIYRNQLNQEFYLHYLNHSGGSLRV